ncbi:MAG: PD-(D/E)XK nuclease family protein, partial [Clostridia bacterium]
THATAAALLREPALTPAEALARARAAEPHQALVDPALDPTLQQWARNAVEAVPGDVQTLQAEAVWLQALPADAGHPVPAGFTITPWEDDLAQRVPYAWLRAQDALRAAGLDAVMAGPDLVLEGGDTVQIRDWKTSRAPVEGPEGLVPRYRAQLGLYGAVARRRYPGRTLALDLQVFVAHAVVPVALSTPDFDAAARRVFETGQALKAAARHGRSAFAKRIGAGCRYCPLAQGVMADGTPFCPEGAAHRHVQGWDRWDERHRTERLAVGIRWMGDPPTTAQPSLF